jgi:hypothetical protein
MKGQQMKVICSYTTLVTINMMSYSKDHTTDLHCSEHLSLMSHTTIPVYLMKLGDEAQEEVE